MKDGGFQKIKNNFSTFDKCYATLADHRVIMILAEGTTRHEKRLRPLRKGTGRLALGTLEQYPELDLQIIPVGVNYNNSDRFRSRAMIQFGQPISAQHYYQKYKDDVNIGIKELTQDLRLALEKNVIQILDKGDEELVEKLFAINDHSWPEAPQPSVSRNNYHLRSEMAIAEGVNKLSEVEKSNLKSAVSKYKKELEQNRVNDYAIATGKTPKVQSWLVIILGFLPFLLGYITNGLPLKLANWIINKKIRAIEFRASVKITTSIVFYLIYWLTLFVIVVFSGRYSLIFLLLAMPFFGYYTLLYQEYLRKWDALRSLNRLTKEEIEALQRARLSLFSKFDMPTSIQLSLNEN
jgi:hypothetical protein